MSQKNRIYILAGQSWVNGQSGGISDLQTGYKDIYQHNSRIWGGTDFEPIYSPDNNNQFPIANRNTGSSIEFYMKDIADITTNDIYIIKYAQGSTRLEQDATRPDWNINSTGELYDGLVTAITDAKAWMTARGKDYEFAGLVWWQGEGDSFIESASLVYQTNLQAFYDAIVSITKASLPIYQYNIIDTENPNERDYKDNVNTAKSTFTLAAPTYRKLFDVGTVTFQVDGIHPTVTDYKRIWDDLQKPLLVADL